MGFRVLQLFYFLFLTLVVIGCKKEINSTGVTALGIDNSKVMTVDSFDIETGSIIDDNIITTNPAYLLLGSYNDKDLGIDWNSNKPIISEKDQLAQEFSTFVSPF